MMEFDIYGNPIGSKAKKKTLACIDINDMDKKDAHIAMMQRHSYKGNSRRRI